MTRSNIKKRASELTKQNIEVGIFAAVVPGLLSALTTVFAPFATGGFLYGQNKVYLDIARQGNAQLEDIFNGFKDFKKFTTGLLVYIIKMLYIGIGTMLFIIPGIILSLRFIFAELIMADEENITALEAINKSRFLTKDRMGEVFSFLLSFLPWFLLSIVPILGWIILAVYVIPYFKVALAAYYYTLKDEAIRSAERKAKFRYPGGTPTRKRLDAGEAAVQQGFAQQQAIAQQQAYMQQQAYYNYQVSQQPTVQNPEDKQ